MLLNKLLNELSLEILSNTVDWIKSSVKLIEVRSKFYKTGHFISVYS